MPWLTGVGRVPDALQRRQFGRLCATLQQLGIDDAGWTVRDVMDLLDAWNVRRGWYSIPAGRQRDPIALVAHQIRCSLADSQDPTPPVERRRIEAWRIATARDRQAADQAAHDAAWEAEQADPHVQSRIAGRIAGLKRHLHDVTSRDTPVTPPAVASPTPRAWRS